MSIINFLQNLQSFHLWPHTTPKPFSPFTTGTTPSLASPPLEIKAFVSGAGIS